MINIYGSSRYKINKKSLKNFAQSLIEKYQIGKIAVVNIVLVGKPPQVFSDRQDITDLPGNVGEIPFSLSAIGGYSNISTFLTDLENLRRPLKIDQATMSIAEIEAGKTLSLAVTGRIPYFLKEDRKDQQ